jgi:hypothetical protein
VYGLVVAVGDIAIQAFVSGRLSWLTQAMFKVI